jgi:hypothetical protein
VSPSNEQSAIEAYFGFGNRPDNRESQRQYAKSKYRLLLTIVAVKRCLLGRFGPQESDSLDFVQFALVFVSILDKNDQQNVKDSLKFTIDWEGLKDVGDWSEQHCGFSVWQQIGGLSQKFRFLSRSLCIKEIRKGDIIDKLM